MLGLVFEDIILVRIVNHTEELSIVSSRRFTIVILHIGLKFPSGREDLLFEMYILLV